MESKTFKNGYYLLQLENQVEGGIYKCRVPKAYHQDAGIGLQKVPEAELFVSQVRILQVQEY